MIYLQQHGEMVIFQFAKCKRLPEGQISPIQW